MEEKKSTYRGYTQAQGRANRKYNDANYEIMAIHVRKGTRQKYKDAAARAGMSFAGFVIAALDEKIEREQGTD